MENTDNEQNPLKITQAYYDSQDADNFYATIWGGEDIHIGIYQYPDENIAIASNRTIRQMLSTLKLVNEDTTFLDLGSGYGGAARYIASTFRSHVQCLNISETENQRNREKNNTLGLSPYINVKQGNFEDIPFEDETFDVVWSEDSILHSDKKEQVFKEVFRVLKKGGRFIFTDPMQSDDCPEGVLKPILERIHLKELGSVKRYKTIAKKLGFTELQIIEMPDQMTNHYQQVLKTMDLQKRKLLKVISSEYMEHMSKGLSHWIEGGKKGYLNWGILLFQKK